MESKAPDERISLLVKRTILFALVLFSNLLFAGSTGSFRGRVVNRPDPDADKNWVYVQAARGAVRRVDITNAKLTFAPEIRGKSGVPKPQDALREGAEVRVTASQDDDGEWKASAVEILAPSQR